MFSCKYAEPDSSYFDASPDVGVNEHEHNEKFACISHICGEILTNALLTYLKIT